MEAMERESLWIAGGLLPTLVLQHEGPGKRSRSWAGSALLVNRAEFLRI